jgi:hypothetical protein
MFNIGRAPKVSKYKRRTDKRKSKNLPVPVNTSDKDDDDIDVLFNPRPKSWLLLPERSLSYFEREMLRGHEVDSFSNPYLRSISFGRRFPEDSIGFAFAKGAFQLKMPHADISSLIITSFYKNMRVRFALKKVYSLWKKKHMRVVNDVDIVTQDAPVKSVLLVNWQTKTIHKFEANTILRDMFLRLIHHDVLVLEPLSPRNPFTNSDLTYGNCLSIHEQLRNAGVTNWLWEAFAESNFNMETLKENFEAPMKLYCLDLLLKDSTNYDTLELVMDFILSEYNYHLITLPPSETLVLGVLKYQWSKPIIQRWVELCRKFWRGMIKHNIEQSIHATSMKLINLSKGWGIHMTTYSVYLNIS